MSINIRKAFETAQAEDRPTFIVYIVAGFPDVETTIQIMLSLEKSGVDIIELGIPFTDPLADGEIIERAHVAALKLDVDIDTCFEIVVAARERGLKTPIIFMGYFNSIYQYGQKKLTEKCSQVGVDGFIVCDLPPEEAIELRADCSEFGLSYIPLVSPVTPDSRISSLSYISDSFMYVVSRMSVTGIRAEVNNDLPELLANIRKHSNLPLAVGFGISTKEQFKFVGNLANGLIIGSKIVDLIAKAAPGTEAQTVYDFCYSVSGRKDNDYKRSSSLTFGHTDIDTGIPKALTPSENQWYGEFGGQYIPEAIFGAMNELQLAYDKVRDDPSFWEEFRSYYSYIGRESSLHFANRLTEYANGAQIYLKREDLNHTGSHKINNALGQALLAKRLGKTRIIAETGAGQHGVATATICAKLGLECVVYMGAEDCRRQALNVFRIRILGAKVIPVHTGSATLKDSVNQAMRDWVSNISNTHYLVGSAIGPHPYPMLVRDFQSVIGKETKKQMFELTS
ncbi:Tryptophan synthase, partial [Smittium mucronatum]